MKKSLRIFVAAILVSLLALSIIFIGGCEKAEEKVILEKTTTYYIDTKNTVFLPMQMSIELFADPSSSIILRDDGTATLEIKVKPDIADIANILLGSLDISELLGDTDIKAAVEGMLSDYVPGITVKNFGEGLRMLKLSTGLSINGFDFSDPETQAMFDYIDETGTIPSKLKIPKTLSVTYDAEYHIKKYTAEDGSVYEAVYMGEHNEGSEPMVLMTKSADKETGIGKLNFKIRFLKLNVDAYEKANK